ncbi:hypothetical protein BDF21DRAFT_484838 [Thamnidium elegans]|nr:hypothetical protein BDF21DRAFT_484838 [Thamnidium elegans]
MEYDCSECGVSDNQTKEFYDGSLKIVKVLRDMMYSLYESASRNIRELTLVGFKQKFTMVLCDAPAGYVTRIVRANSLQLSEEPDDVSNMLLPILKATYQGRLLMGHTNMLVRKAPKRVELNLSDSDIILPCYNVGSGKKKRRRDCEI